MGMIDFEVTAGDIEGLLAYAKEHAIDLTVIGPEAPLVDGVVDFCPEVKDKISSAYDGASSLYDAYMASGTSPGIFRKIFDRLAWGFSGDGGVTDEVLSHLPAGFDGIAAQVSGS